MKYIFGIIGAIFVLAGMVGISAATSVMGEICGLLAILIGVVSFGVGGILSWLERIVESRKPAEPVIELTDCVNR